MDKQIRVELSSHRGNVEELRAQPRYTKAEKGKSSLVDNPQMENFGSKDEIHYETILPRVSYEYDRYAQLTDIKISSNGVKKTIGKWNIETLSQRVPEIGKLCSIHDDLNTVKEDIGDLNELRDNIVKTQENIKEHFYDNCCNKEKKGEIENIYKRLLKHIEQYHNRCSVLLSKQKESQQKYVKYQPDIQQFKSNVQQRMLSIKDNCNDLLKDIENKKEELLQTDAISSQIQIHKDDNDTGIHNKKSNHDLFEMHLRPIFISAYSEEIGHMIEGLQAYEKAERDFQTALYLFNKTLRNLQERQKEGEEKLLDFGQRIGHCNQLAKEVLNEYQSWQSSY